MRVILLLGDVRRLDHVDRITLARINELESVQLCGIVEWRVPRPFWQRYSLWRLLLRAYRAIDRLAHSRNAKPAQIADVRSLKVDERIEFDSTAIAQADGEAWSRLRALQADVIASFVYDHAVFKLESAVVHGVWWRGPLPLMDEDIAEAHYLTSTTSRKRPVVDCLWSRRAGSDGPELLESASFRLTSGLSVEKNLQPLSILRPALWERALCNVARSLDGKRQALPGETLQEGVEAPAKSAALAVCASFLHMTRLVGRRTVSKNLHELWQVGIRRTGAPRFTDPLGYQWLQAPPGHWYADPLVINWRGQEWLFVEDFDELHNKGSIACAPVAENGTIGEFQTSLSQPYHLSFPFVFIYNDTVFMIPESGFNNTVELYQAEEFPLRWRLVRTLFRGAAFDTVLVRHAGKFWFFTSVLDDAERRAGRLLLYSADTLDGDWRPHPSNPLSMDARFARSAGGIFSHAGAMLRPSQDGSRVYGGAVHFRRIDELGEGAYQESESGLLSPLDLPVGTGLHTYNRSARFEVIDRRYPTD